jgi:hypothetical protein
MAVWNFEPHPAIQATFPSKTKPASRTLFFTEGDDDLEDESDDESVDDAIVEEEL